MVLQGLQARQGGCQPVGSASVKRMAYFYNTMCLNGRRSVLGSLGTGSYSTTCVNAAAFFSGDSDVGCV